jgi:mRNA interferase RelE/StbE
MNWDLRVAKSAKKNILSFPKKDKEKIIQAFREFITDPYSGDIEKVGGKENVWRRRIGNYRIIYEIDVKSKSIFIGDIRRRTSTTY